MPQRTAVADHLCRNDISDSPFGYAAVSLDAVALRAADRAADYRQPFLFCDFGAFENRPGSDRIDRTGLFEENMFAFFDGIGELLGTEGRRRTEQNDVHIRIDHLFIGIETEETVFVGYLDPLPFERFAAGVEVVGENVSQHCDGQAVAGIAEIDGGTGTPAAASDQARFQRPSVGRLRQQFGNDGFRIFLLIGRGASGSDQ